MPRKSKNIYGKYDERKLELAVTAVKSGLSLRKAAEKYGIPKSTIRDHVTGRILPGARSGPPTAIPAKVEEEIVKKVLNAAEMGFGVTKQQLILKTARYVRQSNLKTPFKMGIPGNDWWRGLKQRHPEIVLRKPEKLSTSRSRMLNKVVVSKYYEDLGNIISELQVSGKPQNIWNCDETGLSYEHDPVRVLARKGVKNLSGRTSNNRENITVLAAINAVGTCMPPMCIVKGKTKRSLYGFATLDAPEGTVWTYQERAWMSDILGQEWFTNVFLKNCGSERPLLLILDSHGSHEVTDLLLKARENDVHILAMPPHTTHHLQPLDKGIFGPLQHKYNRLCTEFMAEHPCHVVDKITWPRIFKNAWQATMTPNNIKSAFKCTGIFPFNPTVLPDQIFSPSAVYDQPMKENMDPSPDDTYIQIDTAETLISTETPPLLNLSYDSALQILQSEELIDTDNLITKNITATTDKAIEMNQQPPSAITILENICSGVTDPINVFDIPKVTPTSSIKKSKKITSHRLLTSDEIIQQKTDALNEKLKKQKEKEERKALRIKKAKTKVKEAQKRRSSTVTSDNLCFICHVDFNSDSFEAQWVACDSCDRWMHVNCIPVTHKVIIDPAVNFYCHECN